MYPRKAIGIYLFLALIAWCGSAHAFTRVALVIGNSSYASFGELPNPQNDAKVIAKLFEQAKFDYVDARTNLSLTEFRMALRQFAARTANADVAVVYFAGHGVEMSGNNYLIPVDAAIAHEVDVEEQAVSLNSVVQAVGSARHLRLIILDACRDNPFTARLRSANAMRASGAGRGVGGSQAAAGLAVVEVDTSNTYVAFAAKAGSLALDGDGQNSPFTGALVAHLGTPGLDVRMALGRVRDQVVRVTNRQQEPFVYGSLGGDVVSLVPTPEQIAALSSSRPSVSAPAVSNSQMGVGTLRSMHENWQLRCQLQGTPPVDQCAVIQSVVAEDRINVGLTLIVLKTADKQGLLLRVVAPNGVLLPSGLGLKLDNKDIGRAGFVRCNPNGCIAEVKVDDKLLKQLTAAKVGTFIVFETPEQGIGIPVQLAGLESGLKALP